MVSALRKDPINRLHNIRDARRARRQRIRELMNRPTTLYIDRDCIPEEIIEALENRLEPPARITFAPLNNESDTDIENNSNVNSDNEQSISSESESSNSYFVNDSGNLNENPRESSFSLSDFEEWEARAEIIQAEEHYNLEDNSALEEIAIEFTPSPSPLFILPDDEGIDDNLPEDFISRLLQNISDDQLLDIIDNIDWSFLEEDDV